MFSPCVLVLTIALQAAMASEEFGPSETVGPVAIEKFQRELSKRGQAIELSPEMNVAKVVREAGDDEVFLFRKGVYKRVMILALPGQTFVGEPGAILDGEYAVPWAFKAQDGDDATDVQIHNLVVTRYAPPKQECAIQGATGWRVIHCEVRESTMGGIAVYGASARTDLSTAMSWSAEIRNCHVHHNEQIGVKAGGENVTVSQCEVDHNNPRGRYIVTWEAGGSKFVRTKKLVVERCSFHDNVGRGIWNDYENRDATIRDNHCFRNTMCGIYHEVSHRATITKNLCEDNGVGYNDPEWVFGAGICVQASDEVTIRANTVRNNANGITAIATSREGGSPLKNLRVIGNTIAMPRGRTGVVWDGKRRSKPWNLDIEFLANTYEAHERCFAWNQDIKQNDFGRAIDWKSWQSFGHERLSKGEHFKLIPAGE